MDILFGNNDLEALCSTERTQNKRLGAVGAKKLRSRLADLDAVSRVSELVAGRPHPLKGDRAGEFALDLDGGRRLVFEPADTPTPVRADGSIDWQRVTRVRITYIGDYHD
ncbi:MAG: killer suppression protein HigA [Gemmatimonadota bacterium]